MTPYSFELPEIFTELCISKDLKGAIKLVDECFERFPKESDSITCAILEGLRDGANNDDKFFFIYLLKHLELLYLEWARSQ